MRPPPSYGDNDVVSPILKEFAGSPLLLVKGNGAQSFRPLPPRAEPQHPCTSEKAYKESMGGLVAGTPSGTAYLTRPCFSQEMDSTNLTTGLSPSASRHSNWSPWSTKMLRQRPAHTAHTNEMGAATFIETPRSSTTSVMRDRQNSFHLINSARFTPSVKTTQVHDSTKSSFNASATWTTASGFNSWSRGAQTWSLGRPTSGAPMKKFAPRSLSAQGFGS